MLIENTLFGPVNKIETALERIRAFEKIAVQVDAAGYYVCISGGKDSSAIQELCIMAGVKCEFVHNHTSVDHPETVYFVRREMKRLREQGHIFRIEYPRYCDGRQKTMWHGIVVKGLPSPRKRWCCEILKEFGGAGRYCITGVRWAESLKRRGRGIHEEITKRRQDKIILNNDNDMKRRLAETCLPKRKYILNPIIDWKDEDVWEFLKLRKVPVNPLYAQGRSRVGCIGCPLAANQKKELDDFPKYKAAYFRAVQRHYAHRKEAGLPDKDGFPTPESYFNWWLDGFNSSGAGDIDLWGED
jgi:phosphoadenosine phosphosulfate reductase